MTQKVLVTGANGFIGRHVVETLLKRGSNVIAIDKKNNNLPSDVDFKSVNIFESNLKNIYEELDSPDVCIHLAWRDGFVHNSRNHITDLSNHFAFLTQLIDSGLGMLTVMGTMHEVGYWEGAIDSETPCKPLSLYGIAKNSLREALCSYLAGKSCKLHWLRAYYITGDVIHSKNIFSKIYRAAQEGKKTFPFTSGRNLYDFIDVELLAQQIVVASLQSKVTGTINCCSGIPVSLGEKVEAFIKENNLDISLEYGAFPDREYDSPGVWGDARLISNLMMLDKCNK